MQFGTDRGLKFPSFEGFTFEVSVLGILELPSFRVLKFDSAIWSFDNLEFFSFAFSSFRSFAVFPLWI